jgi:hypothetical protein
MDLNNYFQRYKSNKLLGAISYQINIMDEMDNKIIKTVQILNKQLNLKYRVNYDISFIILLMRLIYNSYACISYLPHMLDKLLINGKPCLHIIMSESIAQLVSISLSSECYHVLDDSLKKIHNNKKNILELKKIFIKVFSEIPFLQIEHLLDNTNDHNKLQEYCNNIKNRILNSTEKLCHEYFNYISQINIDKNINYSKVIQLVN